MGAGAGYTVEIDGIEPDFSKISLKRDGDKVLFDIPIKKGTADIYANARNCYHVGIYTGDDNIIHSCARNPKGGVHETTIDEYKEGKNRTVSGDDAYAIKHGTKEVYLRYVGEETANEYNRILQTQGQDAALAYLNGGA